MKSAAVVLFLLGVVLSVPARSQVQEDLPQEVCLTPAQTRGLMIADKLVPPFRIMRETAAAVQAEAIDILLCRESGKLVYDVTLLNQGGRVFHRLIDAASGSPMPNQSSEPPPAPAPRPFFPGLRPGLNFFPGRGPNPYFGPRFGPNAFGPRFRPNIYGGQRFWPNAFQGQGPGSFFSR